MPTGLRSEMERRRMTGGRRGIASVCTAHPIAIEAALRHGLATDSPVLIEATCNQVNQEGGYTGMKPADFRRFVEALAARVGFDLGRLILGGDHLGPSPWKGLPADEAMRRAEAMVDGYAAAGFAKLHLDTSMGCAGEPAALPDDIVAKRATRLAEVAERATKGSDRAPVYVVGTEVPPPGGAVHALDCIEVTKPDVALRTIDLHRAAFASRGLEAAFERVIALVVQPGVEFGNDSVVVYDRTRARPLRETLAAAPQFVFEAHSTDYQPGAALIELVDDGFAILKVGPALTFAIREALYGLDCIANVLGPADNDAGLRKTMETLMLMKPEHWQTHYRGEAADVRWQRHFSYSDRVRYYWNLAEAQNAVRKLAERLENIRIPEPLISQYLGQLHPAVIEGRVPPTFDTLQIAAVENVLIAYSDACAAAHHPSSSGELGSR